MPTAVARSLRLLNDYLGDCMNQLVLRPRGTHIGELGWSYLAESLPRRWLTRYDYDFCWQLRQRLTAITIGSTAECLADDLILDLLAELEVSFGEDRADDHPGTIQERLSGIEPEDWFATTRYCSISGVVRASLRPAGPSTRGQP